MSGVRKQDVPPVLIWAGSALEARQYAYDNQIPRKEYIYVREYPDLLGRHGSTIVKVGTYRNQRDARIMLSLIDDESGTVI